MLVIAIQPARAYPEYASQFNEPCATCHVSAAGGGPRSPRGQAWVWNWASGRQGAVPDLEQALAILGVKLTAEPGFYTRVTEERPQARLSAVSTPDKTRAVLDWLLEYQGN
jgi:mono/diheme cytochrome c family protein